MFMLAVAIHCSRCSYEQSFPAFPPFLCNLCLFNETKPDLVFKKRRPRTYVFPVAKVILQIPVCHCGRKALSAWCFRRCDTSHGQESVTNIGAHGHPGMFIKCILS